MLRFFFVKGNKRKIDIIEFIIFKFKNYSLMFGILVFENWISGSVEDALESWADWISFFKVEVWFCLD